MVCLSVCCLCQEFAFRPAESGWIERRMNGADHAVTNERGILVAEEFTSSIVVLSMVICSGLQSFIGSGFFDEVRISHFPSKYCGSSLASSNEGCLVRLYGTLQRQRQR
jgi:hypothetical protein